MKRRKAILKLKHLSNKEYIIFLFHGVIKKKNRDKIRNYTNKHILEKDFISFLKQVRKIGNPIKIDDLEYYKMKKKILPKKSFIISFDDGYENNFSVVAPILKKLKIPAVFYFSTDFVENNSMSWIDKIEHCFENFNGKISLPWRSKKILLNNKTNKIKYLNEIRKIIKKSKNIKVNNFVNYIFLSTGENMIKTSNRNIDKKISWEQTKKLTKSKLFTVGGHSHEHLSLGLWDKDNMKNQINKSLNLFKKRINFVPKHYSYPEGQKIDFNNDTIKHLKAKKIKVCPSAIEGTNTLSSDLFSLRRIIVE